MKSVPSTDSLLRHNIGNSSSSNSSSKDDLYVAGAGDIVSTPPKRPTLSPTKNRRHVQHHQTPAQTLRWPQIVANCAIRFVLWSLFGYILFLSVADVQPGKGLFSWHPPLLTLSFVLMSESIMCFSPNNLPTNRLAHHTKVAVHWRLQAVAVAVALIGFAVVCLHKWRADKSHFATYHAQYGLAGLLASVATGALGTAANQGQRLRHLWRPINAKIVHAVVALLNYKLFAVATALGFWSSWFAKHGSVGGKFGGGAAVVVLLLLVTAKPTRTLFERARRAWMGAYGL